MRVLDSQIVVVLVASLSLRAPSASADPIETKAENGDAAETNSDATSSAALAEATFDQARERLRAGETEKACSLFRASHDLDPALGTQLMLAHCYEQLGRTATAWALFREVVARAERSLDKERADIARVRAASLTPRLSKIVIEPGEGPHRARQISIDGVALPNASWGIEVPADPGSRVLRAEAPGHAVWEQRVLVSDGAGVTQVAIPELTPLPKAETKPNAATAPSRAPRAAEAEEQTPSRGWWYALGGTGLALAGVGGAFALLAQKDYDASLKQCRTETLCSPAGLSRREDAEDKAQVATLGVAAGLGLVAVSASFLLFSSRDTTESANAVQGEESALRVNIGPDRSSLSWGGRF